MILSDKETLEINLNEHSSLNFLLPISNDYRRSTEDLLKRFHQTNTRKTDTNHILTEMTLRK